MHVYGQLFATLTPDHVITGELARGHTITGELTIPSTPGLELYGGPYEVTPKAWDAQVLATNGKLMTDDVTVFKIPYYETSNVFDGLTVFIAEDING